MRTGFDFLTSLEGRTISRAVRALVEEFDAARLLESGNARSGILKIVLFDAHALCSLDEPASRSKDRWSGFDLLVVVDDKRFTDRDIFWAKAEDRLKRNAGIISAFVPPIRFMIHSMEEVDESLSQGSPFFGAIARDGVVLFESDERPLRTAARNPPERELAIAIQRFDEWSFSVAHFREEANFAVRDQDYGQTAVFLHQAADRLYRCVLAVAAGYTPLAGDLGLLRSLAESVDPRLARVWPTRRRGDRAIFAKLKDLDPRSRSGGDCDMTEDELAWLAAQIDELGRVVHTVCSERIAALKAEAMPA